MNNKKLQFSLFAVLALILASALITTIVSGYRSKNALQAGAKGQKSSVTKKDSPPPVPSLARPSDADRQAEQERNGEIAEVRATRMNPTPANMKRLVALIDTNKDPAILSEALNTLGVLAQRGINSEQACKLLAQKALDKDFPSRGEALLVDAILEKDKALPVVSAFLQGAGGGQKPEDSAMLGWASRALGMMATPQSVPLIEKLISQTNDPEVRGAAFAALAKAGSPQAFSLLKQQSQSTTGKNQAYSVAALSESKDPQVRQWIVDAIQNGTLGKDAVSMLAVMPSAPDIFGKVLTEGGLSPAKQLDMLQQIEPGLHGNPGRQKLAVALAPLVYTGDPKVQGEAIKLISQSGGKQAADIIKPFLTSEDPELRKDAFFSYMRFASADNYKYLFDFLDDQKPETRKMAIFMIGKFYGASDRSALEQAAQSSDAFVRDKANQYLSSLN
ncbi:MAG: HEAT repeat domain-containing protein [Syntrophobacteraceae bacterium]|nr:HEAT repeat domain-containing protein [Syntrophobacteraceae bacterium]